MEHKVVFSMSTFLWHELYFVTLPSRMRHTEYGLSFFFFFFFLIFPFKAVYRVFQKFFFLLWKCLKILLLNARRICVSIFLNGVLRRVNPFECRVLFDTYEEWLWNCLVAHYFGLKLLKCLEPKKKLHCALPGYLDYENKRLKLLL